MALQSSQTKSNENNNYYHLEKKIDIITKSLSRAYYKNILLKLADRNNQNANTICNYIIAEQTEINIKNSTKESRIKVIVWLSTSLKINYLLKK